ASVQRWNFGWRGLELSPFDDVNLRFGARLHYDFAQFDPDVTPMDDDSEVRRLRVSVSGTIEDDWSFFVERDVAGTSQGWKEAWLRYRPCAGLELTGGSQVAPFSIDEITTSNETLFVERALPNALAAGLYIGLAARAYGDSWSAS